MMARLMAHHVGEDYDGTINGVSEYGMYITLSNGAEGFVPVRTLEEKQEPQADESRLAQGLWSRKTTLQPGEIWDVSSVLGIFAPGQKRRSFLAYMERERVMPYRPFIHYNSWYELNINRNNDSDPAKRMTEEQCLAVLKDWQEQFFQKRGKIVRQFTGDSHGLSRARVHEAKFLRVQALAVLTQFGLFAAVDHIA